MEDNLTKMEQQSDIRERLVDLEKRLGIQNDTRNQQIFEGLNTLKQQIQQLEQELAQQEKENPWTFKIAKFWQRLKSLLRK